ncbi:MAG: MreB/Mrl family cell shape determining protein [Candidatus Moranbacteria bacterium]|nr:MreB/Mrl family cell shape determining protein [Candidatus Moranbacteria bacterium]
MTIFGKKNIGIDLGTVNSLVSISGKGIVLDEPSVVALSVEDNKILAIGKQAKEMIGRTPDLISAARPMKDGVIADFRITEAMLRYFIDKTSGRIRFFKPEVVISIPAGITSTEKRAVIDAAIEAGAKSAFVVKEPILAAIGANIPIDSCSGNMIVDIGGGTTEVAMISLGGVVAANSARVGGNKIDEAIKEYIRKRHALIIGDWTAEQVKIKIGSAIAMQKPKSMEIKGRDLMAGLPKIISIQTNEIVEAITDELREIVLAIKKVLQQIPPELSADIIDKGMVLSGGGSMLRNIDQLISRSVGVPCYLADEPLLCVSKGINLVLDNLEMYKTSIITR